MKLYLDEDSQRNSLIRALRARGIDVTTAMEADLLGRLDEENLDYASAQGRVLFSFNRGDFDKLHRIYLTTELHHCGIVVSDQLETGVILRRLLKFLNARTAQDMQDWLEYLSNWR
ncbi:MAG: DUF5615 family PIN-like protein [Caldilineaceae bacterium]|nr:DUF5615 family PIN-like protein [Caldilineaceae bacterium]MCB9157139.1 DUF5615 family PIN-like protein [Caldilineaceae bacterium]